jgi:hypothetical protein
MLFSTLLTAEQKLMKEQRALLQAPTIEPHSGNGEH